MIADVGGELGKARLGDPRLAKRVAWMASALVKAPGASLPAAMGNAAGREAAYRFLSNRRVSLDRVLAPHTEATVARARVAGKVLVVSDTTGFEFTTDREGLGMLSSEQQRGFLGHFTLAVSADGRRTPLGVLGIETLTRPARKPKRDHFARKKDPNRESLRWQRCAEAASQKLDGIEAIHVMDAEADIYELMAALVGAGRRFIIRSAQDRSVETGRLFEALEGAPIRFSRQVSLSRRPADRRPEGRRAHPPRAERGANLVVSTSRVNIKKATSACDPGLPESIAVNVVRVWEPAPPPGQEPVEWRLFTTESVDTQRQVEELVDAYRARWLIEEYFKALKTGCNYQRSQLESFDALKNLLGIYAAVAWQLLTIRSAARDEPERPASTVLSLSQLTVLRLIARGKPLSHSPSVFEAMMAIAALGAHIKSNGQPGWQVLGRGLEELRRAEDLHSRMISALSRDQS
jgi:Transposase DNA-binding/Transposase DDE domain